MPEDPIRGGALALSHLIRRRAISCREVMRLTLERVAAEDRIYNAVPILRDPEVLLREADAADADLARGHWRGWLHGIPQAVKDLSTVAGIRTTWGSPIFADFVPAEDAIHVARVRAAGALFIGKTNTPEWGLGSHSYNPVHGVTRNAHDPALSAGGSSGGAAVALARGYLSVADGSDMGGSLRNPAGWNGVIGFRPSYGRVPATAPDEAFVNTLSTDGPMGVSVADVAALLATQAGYDPRAPNSLGDVPEVLRDLDTLDPKGLRIGWIGDWNGHLPMEDGVLAVCEAALGRLAAAGAIVEPVVPGFDPERLWRAWVTLRHYMVGGKQKPNYNDPRRRALLKPEAIYEIEGSLGLSAQDVYAAYKDRTAWMRATLSLFERFDLLALPTAQVFAFPAEWHWPKEIVGRTMDTYHRWMEVVIGPTMAGGPAIALPAGTDSRGRHMGLQLWGASRADAFVLRAAAAYERIGGSSAPSGGR